MATDLKEYIVNESAEFSKMDNNPLIYTLIIPKILHATNIDDVKNDEQIKNAINITEKFIKTLDKNQVKQLTGYIRPYVVMDIFKLSKNYKDTFSKFFADFKSLLCLNETNFTKCMELDKKFDELYNSPEYQIYKNTL